MELVRAAELRGGYCAELEVCTQAAAARAWIDSIGRVNKRVGGAERRV